MPQRLARMERRTRRHPADKFGDSGNGLTVLTVVLTLVAWEVIGRSANFIYLPPVSEILVAFWKLIIDGTIPNEIAASLVAFAAGMAISIVGGLAIGLLMGVSRLFRWTLDVYVDALMTAPVVAFVPLFIVLFGLGFQVRVATVVVFAIFPIIINTMAGIRGVDTNVLLMGKSFGAGTWRRFIDIQLPAAFSHIQTGLRTAAARGVDGVITGEVLIASVGIGGLINRFGNGFAMPKLYAVVIVIVLFVLIASKAVDLLGLLVPQGRKRKGAISSTRAKAKRMTISA